jgi:hypothetical protein
MHGDSKGLGCHCECIVFTVRGQMLPRPIAPSFSYTTSYNRIRHTIVAKTEKQ